MESIKRREQEIRMLRHDMRLFLNSLYVCIENGTAAEAQKMIAGYSANVESTAVQRYCDNSILNYILSAFATKCVSSHTEFIPIVEVSEISVDEVMLSSIISNALDNALNAQKGLPESERTIKLMLKNQTGKLLLSVRNPFLKKAVFVDGTPVSSRKGHGYGAQSIRYLTERMGGKCRFSTEENIFSLQVII